MGRLLQQRRGKGTAVYKSPSHRYVGKIEFPAVADKAIKGEVIDVINSRGHSAPLAYIQYENEDATLIPAPLGVKVGDIVYTGAKSEIKAGSIAHLSDIPTGTEVYDIEIVPFSNGKLVRACGSAAKVIAKTKKAVTVQLPSGSRMDIDPKCRAVIGRIAGGGRSDKPFVKAGNKFKARKARNKMYPRTSGVAMNACDHPFGGTHRRTKGRSMSTSKTAPPGRKVGHIASRRTGRRKK